MKSERFTFMSKLGEGTFGEVYYALDNKQNRKVAIKQLKQSQFNNDGISQTIVREIGILKMIKSKQVANLLEVQTENKSFYLILEQIDNDLRKLIDDSSININESLMKQLTYQLLKATNECHKYRIIHRDIKPQNILIDQNFNIKLCDFGLAKMFSFPMATITPNVASLWYKAPELLLGLQNYHTTIDIWSIGLIIVELALRKPLFMGKCEFDQIIKIFKLLGTPNYDNVNQKNWSSKQPDWKCDKSKLCNLLKNKLSKQGIDLILKMLNLQQNDRYDCEDCLNHRYFKDQYFD